MSTSPVTTPAVAAHPVSIKPLMEFAVHRDALLAELQIAQVISAAQKVAPILSHILIEAEDGELAITANNLDESLSVRIPARVKASGAAALPGRKLFDFVRLLPAGDITFRLLENDWVTIIAGRSRTKMHGMSRANFPTSSVIGELPSVPLPKDALKAMIPRVSIAIPSQADRYTLQGAFLEINPERLTLVATDGHRLAQVDAEIALAGVDAKRDAMIPVRTLTLLQGLLGTCKEDAIAFAEDSNSLFFKVGPRLLSSRKMSGKFPNYKAVIPRDNKKTLTLAVKDFETSLRRVAQFADEKSNAVILVADANRITISSKSESTGESEEVLEAPYTHEKIGAGFNVTYLLEFLKSISNSPEVQISFKSFDAAALLKPVQQADDLSSLYVLMPMRT